MLQADYNMSLDELLDILRGKDDEWLYNYWFNSKACCYF
jgi:hypothetical protein